MDSPLVALTLLVTSPILSTSPDIAETKTKRITEELSCCVTSFDSSTAYSPLSYSSLSHNKPIH